MRDDRHAIYGFIDTIGKLGLLKKSPYSFKKFAKILLAHYRDKQDRYDEEYGNAWGN